MIEQILKLLKPFFIWKYNDLLFKYDDKYKAISSEINNIFKNNFFILENNVKNYFNNNKKLQKQIKKQPENIQKYLIEFKSYDFEKYIELDEKIQKKINENFLIKLFIEKYILNDKKLVELYKNFENSILGFRKVFDTELEKFYSWEKINSNTLKLHKKIILNTLNNLLSYSDNKIYFVVQNLYQDFLPYILKNKNIDSKKLKNLHNSINEIYENIIKKENFKMYIYLEDYIKKCLDDIILLINQK